MGGGGAFRLPFFRCCTGTPQPQQAGLAKCLILPGVGCVPSAPPACPGVAERPLPGLISTSAHGASPTQGDTRSLVGRPVLVEGEALKVVSQCISVLRAGAMAAEVGEEHVQRAFRLVGEYLHWFAILEAELDQGIAKLFEIADGSLDVLTANMDFARKVKVVRSAEVYKAEMPDAERKKLLKDTFSLIMKLNDGRKIVAHCRFEASLEGVVFRRAVAESRLRVEDVEWTQTTFERSYADIREATDNLRKLVAEMVPYQPKLDFSDPRNSGLIMLLS